MRKDERPTPHESADALPEWKKIDGVDKFWFTGFPEEIEIALRAARRRLARQVGAWQACDLKQCRRGQDCLGDIPECLTPAPRYVSEEEYEEMRMELRTEVMRRAKELGITKDDDW
jgi:hypothetical protein